MLKCREDGEGLVEDFYDEFGNVCCLALALLWLLYQLWDYVLVGGQ